VLVLSLPCRSWLWPLTGRKKRFVVLTRLCHRLAEEHFSHGGADRKEFQESFKDRVVSYALSATTTDPRCMMEHIREKGLINGQASF
jgi:hypothetical protein